MLGTKWPSLRTQSVITEIQQAWKLRSDIHDINVQPVGTALHCSSAFRAEFAEVSSENGGRNDCFRRHFGGCVGEAVLGWLGTKDHG